MKHKIEHNEYLQINENDQHIHVKKNMSLRNKWKNRNTSTHNDIVKPKHVVNGNETICWKL